MTVARASDCWHLVCFESTHSQRLVTNDVFEEIPFGSVVVVLIYAGLMDRGGCRTTTTLWRAMPRTNWVGYNGHVMVAATFILWNARPKSRSKMLLLKYRTIDLLVFNPLVSSINGMAMRKPPTGHDHPHPCLKKHEGKENAEGISQLDCIPVGRRFISARFGIGS